MTTRRSRPPRSRKTRSTEPPTADVSVAPLRLAGLDAALTDPTETAQLRALEAGWDELLT